MAYTREQINRISADKRAVRNLVYLDTDGNSWKGTEDGRLIKTFTSDKVVSVKHEPGQTPESLREFLEALVAEAASSNVVQVEVDFGDELYTTYKIFTIVDPSVVAGAKLIANIAYDAPTNKELDEIEMDEIICVVGNSRNGSFDLVVKSLSGSLRNKFKVNYSKTWQL